MDSVIQLLPDVMGTLWDSAVRYLLGDENKNICRGRKQTNKQKGTNFSKYNLLDCSGTDGLLGNKCQPFKVWQTVSLWWVCSEGRKNAICWNARQKGEHFIAMDQSLMGAVLPYGAWQSVVSARDQQTLSSILPSSCFFLFKKKSIHGTI